MTKKRIFKRSFFLKPTLGVAKELLGKYLVRKSKTKTGDEEDCFLRGKIVETEAYIGPKDRASHAFGGKTTKRNKIEYLEGGKCYIYLVYGMYWQFNITTGKMGKPECVLIRAIENEKLKNLTNGPGKLCKWLKLDKTFYGEDLIKSKKLWLEQGERIKKSRIVRSKRIGIDYAKEWKNKPWRFYIKGNEFVSRY